MPGLDALRGIAVLSVVFFHGLYWDVAVQPPANSVAARVTSAFTFGWLGVNLFFVLSGFLITGILVDSKSRPRYWRNFYVRRVLRIFPAFALTLIVIKISLHVTWLYVALCLAYMANLTQVLHVGGASYGPLWSLAVEEQFYLGWPWLVKILHRQSLVLVTVGSILLSPLLRFLSASGVLPLGNAHSMTWLISDNFAIGALLALLLRSRWGKVETVKRLAWIMLAGGVILLVVGIPFGVLHRTNLVGSTFQTVPFEFIFGAALLLSLLLGERPGFLLWTKPLRFFGYISYGLYLYHVMVFYFADNAMRGLGFYKAWSVRDWIMRFVIEGTLSTLVAFFSRRYFEEFFLGFKGRLAPPIDR
jgi:peptidoglycan/LPS O-acetylase OafA/YrhL